MATSTRRFFCLPASVLLVATGSPSPSPRVWIRVREPCDSRYRAADSARRIERSWLYSSDPIASVCPTIRRSVSGYLSRLDASTSRLCLDSPRTRSELKSKRRPEAKVTSMPSPTRRTTAPGMSCSSSLACLSMRWPMMAPAAPPMTAPMMAPLAVEPVWFPITPPIAPPAAAPMMAPFCSLVIEEHPDMPATINTANRVRSVLHPNRDDMIFLLECTGPMSLPSIHSRTVPARLTTSCSGAIPPAELVFSPLHDHGNRREAAPEVDQGRVASRRDPPRLAD